MRKSLLILLALLILTASACTGKNSNEEDDGRIKVFASILPLKYFIEKVGGDKVSVDVLVLPGKSPATYEPTPSQVIALSSSDLFFKIGVPFEKGFIDNVESSLKNLRIKDVSDNVRKRKISKHSHDEHEADHDDAEHEDHDEADHDEYEADHHDEEHDEADHDEDEADHHDAEHDEHAEHDDDDEHAGNDDPHIWLSLQASKIIIENIKNSLSEIDPDKSAYYESNAEKIKKEIDVEYNKISAKLKAYKGQRFIVFHPSFGYFADEFGLVQIAVESGGKEPSPSYLEKVISEAKEEGIKVIIAQPEFSVKSAEVIADAIDGKVMMLNPLNPDYLETVNNIADGIIEAF